MAIKNWSNPHLSGNLGKLERSDMTGLTGLTREAAQEKATRLVAQYELGRQAGALLPKEKNLAEQARLEKALGYYEKVERGRTLLGRRAQGLPSEAGENLTLQATEDSEIGKALEFQEMLVLNTQAAQRQNLVLASTQDARSTGSPGNVRRQAQASAQGDAVRVSTLDQPTTADEKAQEEKEIRAPRREDLDKQSAPSNLYLSGPIEFKKQKLTAYDDEAGRRADEALGRVFNVDFLRKTHTFESGIHGYHAIGKLQDGYSALGMYQFRAPAFLATGYLRRLGDGQLQWTGKNGINSAQDFFSAPYVQELAMREYTVVRENEVLAKGTQKFIGTDINWGDRAINITMAGLMGTSHYLGAGGSNSFINTLKEFDFDADEFLSSLPDDKKRKHYEDAIRRLQEFQNIPVSNPK